MYWPDREDVQRYYPQCFQKYKNVIGIIDCTDCGKGPKPNHSTYKPRNTWKKVIGITPAGTISFISKSYGGCASDQFITGDCHVLDKLQYSDNLMADKGFSFDKGLLHVCNTIKIYQKNSSFYPLAKSHLKDSP